MRAGELLRHPLSRTLFSVPRGVGAAGSKRNAQDVPACRRALGNLRFGMFATSLSYHRSVQFWKFSVKQSDAEMRFPIWHRRNILSFYSEAL